MPLGTLAGWVGRLLLLCAVAFWWGAVVIPNLLSLAFPEWLSPDVIPRDLDPNVDFEGRLANRVSVAALLGLGGLALWPAFVSRRRSAGWPAVWGWVTVAVTALVLAWEETSDFHATVLPNLAWRFFGDELVFATGSFVWVLVASPLALAFVASMGFFYVRGLRPGAVRRSFALGLLAWVLVLVLEGLTPVLIRGRAPALMEVLEETLEVGGTLLLALSAASAAIGGATLAQGFQKAGLRKSALGSTIVVVGLGCLFVGLVFRAPLVDARVTGTQPTYWVSLADHQSVAQEFPMPGAPLSRFSLRLANRDPNGRDGSVVWRVLTTSSWSPGRVLREGRVAVPAGDIPAWIDIDFPLLTAEAGRTLFAQVVADIEPEAALRVGMIKEDRYANGRLWVNGEPTWADQDLEFVVHGAAEPTRSKLLSLWRFATSEWQWPVLIAMAAAALTLVTLIPVLLSIAAWPRPLAGGIPSELR